MAGSRPGPAPKRSAERVRAGTPAGGEATEYSAEDLKSFGFDIETMVEPPPEDPTWHDAALLTYRALLRDPARLWMGPAAWAIAWIMCENISREMYPQAIGVVDGGIDNETGERIPGHVAREKVPMKGTTIAALLKWTAANGVHEAERMAIRKEVTFNAPEQDTSRADEPDVVDSREGWFTVIEGGAAG